MAEIKTKRYLFTYTNLPHDKAGDRAGSAIQLEAQYFGMRQAADDAKDLVQRERGFSQSQADQMHIHIDEMTYGEE